MGRQLAQRAGGQQQQPAVPAGAAANVTQPAQQPVAAANATQLAQQQQQQQLVGCLNPANPQCDGQCEMCQPNGQCAPKQGACSAGPNHFWAGTCQAGRCVVSGSRAQLQVVCCLHDCAAFVLGCSCCCCVKTLLPLDPPLSPAAPLPQATGCNNPVNKQCDGQCQACAASGLCVAKPGPCKAGPKQQWAGICSAGTCQVRAAWEGRSALEHAAQPTCLFCTACCLGIGPVRRPASFSSSVQRTAHPQTPAPSPTLSPQAIGCNNPAATGEDRCDSQCETCQATGACQPKSGDCALSSTRGLVKGKCMAGMCQVRAAAAAGPIWFCL